MLKQIALIGNPNCGKTTLFNTLTGTYQRVGNWAGVTVDKKEGKYKQNKDIEIIDLPGLYSFNAISKDEKTVIEYIKNNKPDCIINVVDGTNLERNLYLTTSLLTLNVPLVLAVNMCDELEKEGVKLDTEKLSKILGIPVIMVSAKKNKNVDELINIAIANKNIPDNSKLTKYSTAKDVYIKIEEIVKDTTTKLNIKKQEKWQRIDNVITHRVWGFITFFVVILLTYYISINVGGIISTALTDRVEGVNAFFYKTLYNNVPNWLSDLICNGIIKGIGVVLSFLPQILLLFTITSLLESCGYIARVTFIFDKMFRNLGLSGKSVIPFIMSIGCAVTGVSASRTIDNETERERTIYLSPFMPCGAKLAVFGWFSVKLFNGSALVATSLFFISVFAVIGVSLVLKRIKKDSGSLDLFILEMPRLRVPSIKDTFYVLREKVKEFLLKAGSIIFIVSILVWTLQRFGLHGYTTDVTESFLFYIGNSIKYIFYPLGFSNWQASVSILSGILAKEGIIETIELINADVNGMFSSSFSAYAFLVFNLLAFPCVATLGEAKKELKSKRKFAFMILLQFIVAYVLSFLINVAGIIISDKTLLFSAIIVIIILIMLVLSIKTLLKRRRCCNCQTCKRSGIKCRKK